MAGNKNFYTGANSDDGPSPAIWARCPWAELDEDPNRGYRFWDDFLSYNGAGTGRWVETQTSSGTVEQADYVGGAITVEAGASTADQGIQIELAGESFKPAAGLKIWYETRINLTDTLIDNTQLFVGLSTGDSSQMITSGTPEGPSAGSANNIGFCMYENGGSFTDISSAKAIQFRAFKAGTAATIVSPVSETSGTYVKLGFVVDGVKNIKFYVDGVLGAIAGATTSKHPILPAYIPVTEMTAMFVVQAEGQTGTPTMDIDWVRIAQIRTPSDD